MAFVEKRGDWYRVVFRYNGVNADREVQRLPASGLPIEKCSAPTEPFALR